MPSDTSITAPLMQLASVTLDAHIAADTTTPEGTAAAVAACTELLGGAPSLLARCVGSTLISPLHRSTPVQIRDVLRIKAARITGQVIAVDGGFTTVRPLVR